MSCLDSVTALPLHPTSLLTRGAPAGIAWLDLSTECSEGVIHSSSADLQELVERFVQHSANMCGISFLIRRNTA